MWSLFPWFETRHANRRLVSQESKVVVQYSSGSIFGVPILTGTAMSLSL